MSSMRKGKVPSMMEGVYSGRRYMGKQRKLGKCKRIGKRV